MTSLLPVSSIKPNTNLLASYKLPNQYSKGVREALSDSKVEKDFPWIKDKNILLALNELKQITFDSHEVEYLKKVGVTVPFESGDDAVSYLRDSNTRIVFDDMEPEIHAQYDYSKNFININSLYKNTQNTAVILAMAEAILHEAGHAKDQDGESSVQEEINFLGTNALAHRSLQRRYPHMFSTSNERIVRDGVSVYEKLFFDTDTNKNALVRRLQLKYGYLPAGDKKHPPTRLAMRVKGLCLPPINNV